MVTITTANGYYTNLGNNVFLWPQKPIEKDNELPALAIRDTTSEKISETLGGSSSLSYKNLTVAVQVLVASGSTNDTEIRKGITDIYKAIGTDHTFGGKALKTDEVSDEILTDEGEGKENLIIGAEIIVDILYSTTKFSES